MGLQPVLTVQSTGRPLLAPFIFWKLRMLIMAVLLRERYWFHWMTRLQQLKRETMAY